MQKRQGRRSDISTPRRNPGLFRSQKLPLARLERTRAPTVRYPNALPNRITVPIRIVAVKARKQRTLEFMTPLDSVRLPRRFPRSVCRTASRGLHFSDNRYSLGTPFGSPSNMTRTSTTLSFCDKTKMASAFAFGASVNRPKTPTSAVVPSAVLRI